MLPGHEQNASDFPGHLESSGGEIAVYFEQALANTRLEIEYRRECWPILLFLRNFGVRLWLDSQRKFAIQMRAVHLHDTE